MRKLYYVPGVISLLWVPILFYQSLLGVPEQRQTYIRVDLPVEYGGGKNNSLSLGFCIQDHLKGKKIITKHIGAIQYNVIDDLNPPYYNSQLNSLAAELQNLQLSKDTNQIIKIIVDDSCHYKTFVWLFNQVLIDDYHRYGYLGDSMFFFSNAFVESRPDYGSNESDMNKKLSF